MEIEIFQQGVMFLPVARADSLQTQPVRTEWAFRGSDGAESFRIISMEQLEVRFRIFPLGGEMPIQAGHLSAAPGPAIPHDSVFYHPEAPP